MKIRTENEIPSAKTATSLTCDVKPFMLLPHAWIRGQVAHFSMLPYSVFQFDFKFNYYSINPRLEFVHFKGKIT